MRETMDKIPNTNRGSGCFEEQSGTPTSPAVSRLLRCGAAALVVGAVLMSCASLAALYLWKVSDSNVYNVRYSTNVNGEVRQGSVEIDSGNNLKRFKTGSGAEETVEIHDFHLGITGIRFYGGGKCYIKSQIKANLPHVGAANEESLMFDLTDEVTPVSFDEEFFTWVSAEQPLKDTSFLSHRILDLCGDLPIYWLRPIYSKDGERRKRDTQRAKRQLNAEEMEASADGRSPVSHAEGDTSKVVEKEEGPHSAAGSAYNPENPYHRSGGSGEEAAVTFDTVLDHQGVCCAECRRRYTHCQRICQPLRGHWPWPYNHGGCRVACRVIMPCRWWVARILGLV